MAALHVIHPGLLTTVQDLGRWGLQDRGVSVAGPMDPFSHRLANALVGNARIAATLEITLTGPEIEFDAARVIAVCGGEFEVDLNDRGISLNTPIVVQKGGRVRFGKRRRGARAYLAIGGGIEVPPVLGSRSTHVTSQIGGLGGRALRSGDELPIGRWTEGVGRFLPPHLIASTIGTDEDIVRVLRGPHSDQFNARAFSTLSGHAYAVSTDSNRVGLRLVGPSLETNSTSQGEMISEATPLGAIQVTPSGQPIVLMADRQTTGGYPILANVISADIRTLGQLAPGDHVRFALCSREQALAALIATERRLLRLEVH